MNKIFRKAVDELEILKNVGVKENGNIYKFRDSYIEDMITVLEGEVEPDVPIMVDFYKDIEEMLGYCNLSSYERGCVVTKFLTNNLLLADSKPYSYIRPEIYKDSFMKVGVSLSEIFKLYQEFLDTGTVDPESIGYITQCQNLLTSIFFPDEEINDKTVPLVPLKFPKKILRDVLIKFLAKAEKMDYELFCKSVTQFKFCRYLIQVLYDLGCPSPLVAQKVFANYFIDKSLISLKKETANNLVDTFKSVQILEEKHRLTEVRFYLRLKKYFDNPNKTREDILGFKSTLKEKISESLCDDVIYYLDVKNSKKINNKTPEINILSTKKTEVVLPKVSKKKLKNDLKLLYNEETILEVGFDFKNYKRLLKLLKDLNYADSVNQSIFSRIYNFAQKNEDYYDVLYERARVLGKSSIVDEIFEIKKLLKEIPQRERFMWKDQLELLESQITPLYEHDFDYEFKLMREMKQS